MSQPAKMSLILPTPCTFWPASRIEREVVRPPRLEREVVPVRRALVAARLAGEGPRDHAADRVLAGQDLARDPAALVELLERDRLLVRGDLEDGVGRRVDDPLARLLVLLAELLDDVGAGRGLVAEHAAAGPVHERVDHVVREAVRVGRHRRRRDDAHQLPVAGRRVLALRALEQPPGDRRRPRLRRAALERHHVAEAERLERGQVEASDGAGDVPERVRPLVPVLGRIGQLSRADGVEHDHARPRHAAILRRAWTPSSVSSAWSSTSSSIVGLAAAVTWAVVKLSPSKSQKQLDAEESRRLA